jgi:hypothetical protein
VGTIERPFLATPLSLTGSSQCVCGDMTREAKCVILTNDGCLGQMVYPSDVTDGLEHVSLYLVKMSILVRVRIGIGFDLGLRLS